MERYLVTIEFRYNSPPKSEYDSCHKTKTITAGVYDTFEDACKEGNKLLEHLEGKFDLNVYANGVTAPKERFSINGGPMRSKKSLIADLGYLKTPFRFYAKITTLYYRPIEESVIDVVESIDGYRKFKSEDVDCD